MQSSILTEEQKSILKQALWDLNLTPEEFLDIIEGKSTRKWPDQSFCVARFLESANWFQIIKVIDPVTFCGLWNQTKKNVRFKWVKEGMEYASRILH